MAVKSSLTSRQRAKRGRSARFRLSVIVSALTLPAVLLWFSGLMYSYHNQDKVGSGNDVGKPSQAKVKAPTRTVPEPNSILKPKLDKKNPKKKKTGNGGLPADVIPVPTNPIPTENEIIFEELDVVPQVREAINKLVRERPDLYAGKEQLLGMLLEMNLNVTAVTEETWKSVPQWKDIQAVHGPEPIVHGLETCKTYRETVPATSRRVGIAGMFNTGTNLLAILLQHNCGIPERIAIEGRRKGHGMEWQVPWGKHTPEYIGRNKYSVHSKRGMDWPSMKPEDMMVGAMVRHPHDWINSMCRHGYTARWSHTKLNCPNLYNGNTVKARFGAGITTHASIAHMWNDWNGAYFNATYPRLLVRFEDVIFYPKQLSRKICACVGGQFYYPKERDGYFHYVIDSAKVGPGHGPDTHRNGLVDAYSKYGKPRDFSKLSPNDLEFMEKTFDKRLMGALHWKGPA